MVLTIGTRPVAIQYDLQFRQLPCRLANASELETFGEAAELGKLAQASETVTTIASRIFRIWTH
ncbi:hypothetical protein EC9_17720 [Rosistilla ulvae]|uniref:Uncharacterized protein n=1 Tax=Rosistilla ulvae TaxID=1930277 RepID=A0A517LYA4_9BACT|nr:hypothetical protein EC9_17720 [Rosistilla ulvae]